MGATDAVRLVVQSDDFGMCHAVNTGTVEAFVDGIVTQTTAMVPCPWFDEAVQLAGEHAIPTGIHLTLTCEWDFLRWRPLTSGRSLVGDDGTFHRTVEAAAAALDHREAVAELSAQVDRFVDAGLPINHLCPHMGMVATRAYGEVAERCATPFLYPGVSRSLDFTSITFLSDRPDKLAFLLRRLSKLAPGVHLLNAHCATPSDELASITAPGSAPYLYAEAYRRTDLEVLTHPDVLAAIDDLGIELTTSAAAFA